MSAARYTMHAPANTEPRASRTAATVAVIPARGGSKGIPRKNLTPVCGKPLIAWSILQARATATVDSVWVSSDDKEILAVAEEFGARPIVRPLEIAGDFASSESAWLHALDWIEQTGVPIERVVGMQATSPLRAPSDLIRALNQYDRDGCDSLLSVCEIEDFFIWRLNPFGLAEGVNHDPDNRKRRQDIEKRYLENGSLYVFTPQLIRARKNRLGGRIGMFVMDKYKMFQVDVPSDVPMCEAIMRGYGLDRVA